MQEMEKKQQMSSLNLNKVILCGRLTADVELKTTGTGISVCSFNLAVNRPRRAADANSNQPTADFISIVAWRQRAEFIARYFRKGSSICITGSIQTRKWTDQNNATRYATEVIVEDALFVDSKGEGGAAPVPAEEYPPASSDFITVGDEDLPF